MDYTNKVKFAQDKKRGRSGFFIITYLWCYRTVSSKKLSTQKLFAKILLSSVFKMCGVDIETESVGGGLRLPHLNGIFVHKNASIGENCTIFQQVTIGANEHKLDYNGAPQIGNRVYIGAGAKIIGKITIGDDVRIGAKAVVTKNISAGKTVVGCNKIIEKNSERIGII